MPVIMKTICTLLIINLFVMATATAQDTARYIKTSTGYLMVLRQGDDIFKQLEAFAEKEKIPSASFTGFGFVNATFGYFNRETKKYEPKEFSNMELSGLNGSIAWQKGKVSLHTHGTVTDKDFNAFGGHMLGGTVGTGSLEITVIVHPQQLERVFEEPLGANVLSLEKK